MLTKEQMAKVARLGDQTGGFEGFYESTYKKCATPLTQGSKIKLKLVYKELQSGDVVIQKRKK